ncbi:hypothetical protein AALB53_20905 [Lachnospiraceae bacterium 47-T17]
MNEAMGKEQFAEKVLRYVREALPEELAEVRVRTVSMDLWEDGGQAVLLVIRPWSGTVTGFCMDRWYQAYLDRKETAETTAAAIINDRRLYCMPQGDGLDPDGCAVIYA